MTSIADTSRTLFLRARSSPLICLDGALRESGARLSLNTRRAASAPQVFGSLLCHVIIIRSMCLSRRSLTLSDAAAVAALATETDGEITSDVLLTDWSRSGRAMRGCGFAEENELRRSLIRPL